MGLRKRITTNRKTPRPTEICNASFDNPMAEMTESFTDCTKDVSTAI
jgi:hypothetical protein